MNTIEIKNVLKLISKIYSKEYNKQLFVAVCACDELQNIKIDHTFEEAAIIVNTDESSKKGAHWQAIFISHDSNHRKNLSFFDSYGRLPENPHILKFIQGNSYNTIFVIKQLQDFNSVICGQYCCLFILYKALHPKISAFFNLFRNNLVENDKKCQHMFFEKICSHLDLNKVQSCVSFNSCCPKKEK